MDDRYPSEKAERIMVRLPDGMRDHLAEVAKANKRSVNAEVVDALEAWLSRGSREATSRPEAASELPTEANTVYVLLDTDGMPTSWAEILEHLGAITRVSKVNAFNVQARILTSEMIDSRQRDKEAVALFRKYRALTKKTRIKAGVPGRAP